MKAGKKIVLIILLISFTLIIKGQETGSDALVWCLSRMPAAELPVSTGLKKTWDKGPSFGIDQNKVPTLQFHSYTDLGLIEEFGPLHRGVIWGWTKSKHKYNILLIFMGEVDRYRSVIGTFTETGHLIDTLEVEGSFQPGRDYFYTKEFSLDKDQQLIVSQLVSKEEKAIDVLKPFETYHAQRVDTYYKIDSEGKVKPQKRVLYKPQIYDAAYIKDGKKRLMDGDEEFEKEEIIQKE